MKKSVSVLLILGVSVSWLSRGESVFMPSTFRAVRDRVYAKPLTKLPYYTGFSTGGFLQAFLGLGGPLAARIKGTLFRSEDLRTAAPKFFHPMGVCADAKWRITESSPSSGLFERGTEVNGIVRLSVSDTQTRFSSAPKETRAFGVAVKLFPVQSADESIVTSNIQTLDQNGLDGGHRQRFLIADSGSDPVYFRNIATGTGQAAELGGKLFGRFDYHPELRPLYPLSEATADGLFIPPAFAVTYREMRLTPRVDPHGDAVYPDFRDELMSYGPGEIRFDISLVEPSDGSLVRIGELVLGKPVVSVACDQELHFHHHPNNRTNETHLRY